MKSIQKILEEQLENCSIQLYKKEIEIDAIKSKNMKTMKELIKKYQSRVKNLSWCIFMNSGDPIVETSKLQLAAYNEILNDLEQCASEIHSDPKNIMDRVKTFEDACGIVGASITFDKYWARKDEIAYKKLKIIAEALNEGWIPAKTSGEKYFPSFYLDSVECTLHSVICYTCLYWSMGKRLCFKSEELAKYAATQFIDIYKDFLT